MSIRILRRMKWRATAGVPLFFACGLELMDGAAVAQPAPPLASPAPSPGSAATQLLLLDGVRAFRAERYDEALTIFQRVEASEPSSDIGFYLGMTQHKLGRHLEALITLRAARRRGLREPVADYYQAVSCYRLGMLERARQAFSALGVAARTPDTPLLGPRLQQGAQRFSQAIDAARNAEAGDRRQAQLTRLETARSRTDEQLAAGSAAGALEWFTEAVEVLALMPQGVDRAEKLPALRPSFLRLREALRDKPLETELTALWLRVSGGEL